VDISYVEAIISKKCETNMAFRLCPSVKEKRYYVVDIIWDEPVLWLGLNYKESHGY